MGSISLLSTNVAVENKSRQSEPGFEPVAAGLEAKNYLCAMRPQATQDFHHLGNSLELKNKLNNSSLFLPAEKDVEWTGLKFSPDGKTILISTNGSLIRLIDAFNGKLMQSFTGHVNTKSIPLEASFSPDSQFVISGSTDGRVHIWNAENGTKVRITFVTLNAALRLFKFCFKAARKIAASN